VMSDVAKFCPVMNQPRPHNSDTALWSKPPDDRSRSPEYLQIWRCTSIDVRNTPAECRRRESTGECVNSGHELATHHARER
jgi:hypothetical protein